VIEMRGGEDHSGRAELSGLHWLWAVDHSASAVAPCLAGRIEPTPVGQTAHGCGHADDHRFRRPRLPARNAPTG
jgi:hypothetical protein